jgi:hypothetical protein
MATSKKTNDVVTIPELKQGIMKLRMIGKTPMYFNSMSSKARRDLLVGASKKTAAEKKDIKHNPEQEFVDSMHTQSKGDTLLCFPAAGVKGAMATAALETAGVNKTSVNRLIFLPQDKINIWGKPYLKIDVVRSADMNRTPDMRTRAFLPHWCAEVEIHFAMPTFGGKAISTLLRNAGTFVGIGDFRQEKGRGSFGTFSVIGSGDQSDEWDAIVKEDRAVQEAARDNPECFDEDTMELMKFIEEERIRRAA